MTDPVEVVRGDLPLVLAFPHTGTWLPSDAVHRLNATGRAITDTDWHVHDLYAGLVPGATTVRATFHRYVIDANRPPDGQSLYPGQATTGLCPLTDFDGLPLYNEGQEPDAAETLRRLTLFHAPYHAALRAELERVKARHGFALLYDCHSIRSHIPYLFDGKLPDFNIGTNSGSACAPEIAEAVRAVCAGAEGYTHILNGRFKGGWTTRHYGQPDTAVHAIQMELTQSSYMREEAPWDYLPERAETLRPVLQRVLHAALDAASSLYR